MVGLLISLLIIEFFSSLLFSDHYSPLRKLGGVERLDESLKSEGFIWSTYGLPLLLQWLSLILISSA